jgi:putative ABC transport system permease protein
MLRLIINNVKGRVAYNSIIVAAVTLAVTIVLFTLYTTSSAKNELELSRRLLGPNLALVPAGTKEKGQIYLTKGLPEQGMLPAAVAEQIHNFSEIEAATVQKKLGRTQIGNIQATLISIDPETDFVVQPWLESKSAGKTLENSQEIILGCRVAVDKKLGELWEWEGKKFRIIGRLQKTGAYMDTAVFFLENQEWPAESSWLLLRLAQGSSQDIAANRVATNSAPIEVLTGPEMLKTINDQLHGLLRGGGLTLVTLMVVAGALLIIGAMFALMVHERKREFGLLKAMGARNSFVFTLVLGEAAVLGGAGGILGMLLSTCWLLWANIEQPGTGFIAGAMLATLGLTLAVGVVTALYPAWLASRMESYTAIRNGE